MKVGKLVNFPEPPCPYRERGATLRCGSGMLSVADLAYIRCPSKGHYFVPVKCDSGAQQGSGQIGETSR